MFGNKLPMSQRLPGGRGVKTGWLPAWATAKTPRHYIKLSDYLLSNSAPEVSTDSDPRMIFLEKIRGNFVSKNS
jgi:hypothetical protein